MATQCGSLPTYQRVVPSDGTDREKEGGRFHAILGVNPAKVIEAMDSAGDDIPHQKPEQGGEEPKMMSSNKKENSRLVGVAPPQVLNFPLPSVGLRRSGIPVTIKNPFLSSALDNKHDATPKTVAVVVPCDLNIRTSVPADKRGIHTSRIGNAISSCLSPSDDEKEFACFDSLIDFVMTLAKKVDLAEYNCGGTIVEATGKMTFLEEVPGWKAEKNKRSIEQLTLHATAEIPPLVQQQDEVKRELKLSSSRSEEEVFPTLVTFGLSVNHMTACPCVQQTYKHTLLQQHQEGEKEQKQSTVDSQATGNGADGGTTSINAALDLIGPLLTHSQRCTSKVVLGPFPVTIIPDLEVVKKGNVVVNGPQPCVDLKTCFLDLLKVLDRTVHRVQNTLPREHELELVYRSHAKPQFIEDVVRQVVVEVRNYFTTVPTCRETCDVTTTLASQADCNSNNCCNGTTPSLSKESEVMNTSTTPLSHVVVGAPPQVPHQPKIRIHSISYESIHDYDIEADIEVNLVAQ